jgi:hypothetical protein
MQRYRVNDSGTPAGESRVPAPKKSGEAAPTAERRKAGRPWTKPVAEAAAKSEETPPTPVRRAASDAGDSSWKEF